MPNDDIAELLKELLSNSKTSSPELALALAEIQKQREANKFNLDSAAQKSWISRNRPFKVWFPWAVAIGAIVTITTGLSSDWFQTQRNHDDRSHELQASALQYEYNAFEEMIINDFDGNDASDEQRRRICLAATFGLIRVSPSLLGDSRPLRPSEEQIKAAPATANELLVSRYDCDDGALPKQFTAPELVAPTSVLNSQDSAPVLSTLEAIQLRVEIPLEIKFGTEPKQIMQRVAYEEFNLGVHELRLPERVNLYWQAVGGQYKEITGLDRDVPWSAAFTSYLIAESGNPHKLNPSSTHYGIWNEANGKGISETSTDSFEPGSLLFMLRRSRLADGISEVTVDMAREGSARWLGQSGIIIAVTEESIQFIGGNIAHQVKISTIDKDDPKIVGVVNF